MSEFEEIKFEILLGSQFKLNPPHIQILINNDEVYSDLLLEPTTNITFFYRLTFNHLYKIKIIRSQKNYEDINQSVWLEQLKIDGVDIQNIVWTESWYYPVFPEPWYSNQKAAGVNIEYPVLSGTHWGHNGTWELEFSSPFYKFVIDKLK